MHLPISAPSMPGWNKAKTVYILWASTTSPPATLKCITNNRNPKKVASKYMIRSQTQYLTEAVIPDICGCMPFCFGLGYLTVWMNLPKDNNLLMELPLVPPLTSYSLWTKNYGTMFTTMIQRKGFLKPRINLATGLDLYNISVMVLPTGYRQRKKLSWKNPLYDHENILVPLIVAGDHPFMLWGGGEAS